MAKVAKLGQYGRYAEIKAAASVYVATDSLNVENVHGQHFLHLIKLNLTSYQTQGRSLFPSQNYGMRLPTRLGVTMTEFYLSARTAH